MRNAVRDPKLRQSCEQWMIILMGVGLTIVTAGYISRASLALKTSAELDYGEGIVLYQAKHITDYSIAYRRIDEYPFVVTMYPPVYHLATRCVRLLVGDWLRAGRLVSILSMLGICCLIAWIVWYSLPLATPTYRRCASALFGSLLPFTTLSAEWSTFARVDTLGVFLTLGGVATVLRFWRHHWLWTIGCLLFTLALFTRQNLIAAPLATLLGLVVLSRRRALVATVVIALCGLLPLSYLQYVTGGGFLTNIVRYLVNRFSGQQAIGMFAMNLANSWGQLALAGGLVLFGLASLAKRKDLVAKLRGWLGYSPLKRAIVICGLYLIVAGVGTIAVGKEGANVANYTLEFNVVTCLMAGLALAPVMAGIRRLLALGYVQAGLVFMLFTTLLVWQSAVEVVANAPITAKRRESQYKTKEDQHQALLSVVREIPGLVYSQNITVLLEACKEVPAEPVIVTLLARAGGWDETPLIRMIQDGRFDLIITTKDWDAPGSLHFTKNVAEAIHASYRPSRLIGEYILHRPTKDVAGEEQRR